MANPPAMPANIILKFEGRMILEVAVRNIFYLILKSILLATIYDCGMDNYQLRYPLAIVGSEGGASTFYLSAEL
jgi:hypothetical protein